MTISGFCKCAPFVAAALSCLFQATAALAQEASTQTTDDPIAALIAEQARDDAAKAEASDLSVHYAEQAPHPDDLRPVAAPPPGVARPAMWRVADADSEIFLLGTFHILPPNLKWRSNALLRASDQAETIWFEAEVDTPAAREKAMEILRARGLNPPGVTLSGLLSENDAAQLHAIAARLGLRMEQLDRMRPWQAFLALSVQFIASQGFEPGSGVETVLLQEGRARGRQLKFFETVEQQLGLFTSLDPETEKHLLSITLRDWDEQSAEFEALFEAWRAGDVATIDALMNGTMRSEAPDVYEKLIVARNQAWAAKIAREMRGSGRTLVAVGAAHLVGADSVPAMLRAQGFEVTRYGAE